MDKDQKYLELKKLNDSGIDTITDNSITTNTESSEEELTLEKKRLVKILKILYFLSGLNVSSWGRLSTIFYTIKGLTPEQIGLLEVILLAIGFVVLPFWSYISDKYRNKKKVFLFTSAVSTITLSLLGFDFISKYGVYTIFPIVILTNLFSAGSILDPYSVEVLGKDSKQWGEIRVWTAISWGIGSLIFSSIYSYFKSFLLNFFFFFTMNIITLLVTYYYVPARNRVEKELVNHKPNFKEVLVIFKDIKVIFFILEFVCIRINFCFVEKLLFIYLLKELKAEMWLTGLTVFVTVTFELPIFFYSEKIMKKTNLLVRMGISIFSHVIRMFGYVILTHETVNYILLFEFMHGITYAFMAISRMEFIKEISPKGIITSINTIFSLLSSLGFCIGSLLGGYIMQEYNGKTLYMFSAIFMSVLFICHLIVSIYGFLSKRQRIDANSKEIVDLIA